MGPQDWMTIIAFFTTAVFVIKKTKAIKIRLEWTPKKIEVTIRAKKH